MHRQSTQGRGKQQRETRLTGGALQSGDLSMRLTSGLLATRCSYVVELFRVWPMSATTPSLQSHALHSALLHHAYLMPIQLSAW